MSHKPSTWERLFPIIGWARDYSRQQLSADMVAAIIVTILLIPQSLAYALIAGLPAEAGLYASILPLVAYGIFGSSRVLAVGPVAIVSLMTAAAIAKLNLPSVEMMWAAASLLAIMSGVFLMALGLLRLGVLSHFISHSVTSGFITASAIIIAVGQLKHLFGIPITGDNLFEQTATLIAGINQFHLQTFVLGFLALTAIFWMKIGLKPLLIRLGMSEKMSGIAAKMGPVFVVIATTLCAYLMDLGSQGVALVGDIPASLPPLSIPRINYQLLSDLVIPAILISIIGFVESMSVANTLAAKKRQKVDANNELIGLGAANMLSGINRGFPVTGGLSRSAVNFDAGAQTPAAGIFTAICIAVATLFITPLLAYLPKATLAATIIVAVIGLVDFGTIKRSWAFSKADFSVLMTTITLTLFLGVEVGVSLGILLSLLVLIYKSANPHVAEVGNITGTQHFRNVQRHDVETHAHILSLRVDEQLYFANAHSLGEYILMRVDERKQLKHVVLLCSAVNDIDMGALEALEHINADLADKGITLHLSEVKGPVMDKLNSDGITEKLSGDVFLTHWQAINCLKETV